MNRYLPILLLLLPLGCTSPPEQGPSLPVQNHSRNNPIVAFYKGKPITWSQVSKKALQIDRKRTLDIYLRWRVMEDAIQKLSLSPSPLDRHHRASQIVQEERTQLGKKAFFSRLKQSNLSEKEYVTQLAQSPLLKETLVREQVLRYDAVRRGWVEYDQWGFSSIKEAEQFRASGKAPKTPPLRLILYGNMHPTGLSKPTIDLLFSTPRGEKTLPLQGPHGTYRIMKVHEKSQARPVPWAEVKREVFSWILRNPPSRAEFLNWIDDQLKRSKIEYAHRSAERN